MARRVSSSIASSSGVGVTRSSMVSPSFNSVAANGESIESMGAIAGSSSSTLWFGEADGVRDFLRKRVTSQLLGDLGPCEERPGGTSGMRFTGIRIMRAFSASARRIPCWIQWVAKVEKRAPTAGSKRSTARIKADAPFLNQVDEVEAAALEIVWATHTTSRKLHSTKMRRTSSISASVSESASRRRRDGSATSRARRSTLANRRRVERRDRSFRREDLERDGATVLAL